MYTTMNCFYFGFVFLSLPVCVLYGSLARICLCTCMCIYLGVCFCMFQTTCRQSQAYLVQTGLTATVPSVETKPQVNTTEPLAVMAAKVSSDAPYARATSTPAGTENKNILHEHTYAYKNTAFKNLNKYEKCQSVHY